MSKVSRRVYKRNKKRYTKERYTKKRYTKKRYTKKRYTKKRHKNGRMFKRKNYTKQKRRIMRGGGYLSIDVFLLNSNRESDKKVETIVKDCEMRDFYMNQVEELLKTYEPGKSSMKPDVLKQIIEIEEQRRKKAETMAQNMANENKKCIVIKGDNGESRKLTLDETLQLLQQQQTTIQNLTQQLKGKELEIDLIEKTHQAELNEKNERSIIMSDNNGVKTPLSLEQVADIMRNQKIHIINITNNLQKKDDEVNELRENLQKAENKIEILQNITSMKETENIYLKITETETTIDNIE